MATSLATTGRASRTASARLMTSTGVLLLLASSAFMMQSATAARQLSAASSQRRQLVQTGAEGVCCAYILDSSDSWVLVCNDPTNIPGALPFPDGTIVYDIKYIPGQIAQCIGSFPDPVPAPYKLPANTTQLTQAPGGGSCANQFGSFYEGLGADGGFVVQCSF